MYTILWHSNTLVANKRFCVIQIDAEDWKLILINAYMSYEYDDIKSDECVHIIKL